MQITVIVGNSTEFEVEKGTVIFVPGAYGQTLVAIKDQREELAWGTTHVEEKTKFFAFNASGLDMSIEVISG